MSTCMIHRRSLSPVSPGAAGDHWTPTSSRKTCDIDTDAGAGVRRRRAVSVLRRATAVTGRHPRSTAGEVLRQHGGTTVNVARRRQRHEGWSVSTDAVRRLKHGPAGNSSPADFGNLCSIKHSSTGPPSSHSSCIGDSMSLWTKISVHLKPPTPASSASLSADDFAAFFMEKVNYIRSATAGAPPPAIDARADADQLSTFKPVTDDEIHRLLSALPAKQCALDPAPTWLIKQLADVISPVICHLCNMSLLSCHLQLPGLPRSTLEPLQRVQNAAARLVFGLSRFDHVTPSLIQLHWLPVIYRVKFKLCCIIHAVYYGRSPTYLSEAVQSVSPSR